MHHGPNWAEPTPEAFRELIAPIVARDGWVIDGMYHQKLGTMVPEAADTVVWIDLPLALTIGRLLRRTTGRLVRARGAVERQPRVARRLRSVGGSRCRLGDTNTTAGTGGCCRRAWPGEPYAGKRVVRLRSQRDIDRFLESLPR